LETKAEISAAHPNEVTKNSRRKVAVKITFV